MNAQRTLQQPPPNVCTGGGVDRAEGYVDESSFSSLALGAAHDLRNLLFVVTAHCHSLAQALALDDPKRGDLDAITTAAGRCVGLTQQLLRAGRGNDPARKSVNLNQITRGLGELLALLVGDRITVVTHLADDLWPLNANPVQMEQVVINLATNARDAMPDRGTLTITTQNRAGAGNEDAVVLTIEDTGTGMTPDVQARMFEPYFTTKGMSGTGVGLATVRGIVTGARGRFEVESTPERGSRISVVFPREGVRHTAVAHKDTRPPNPARILLVEDEPGVRALLTHCLEMEGYELIVAASGTEALDLCLGAEAALDLIVTDFNLPDILGTDVAARLRQRMPDLGVIFMSGCADATASVVTDGRTVPLLAKPFTLAEFSSTVRGALPSGRAA